jgi:rhamnulokinase
MGLWLVQELRRMWRAADGREMNWGEIVTLVERAHPFTAFVDPDDPSFYNPADMELAIATFCERTHQPVPQDRGTYLRVVYESLAMKYRAVNEEISRLCGKQTKAIHIVGGGCRNEMLSQFTADATGVNVFAGPEEATAVGNILVQAMALRIINTIEEALPVIREAFEIKPYSPRDPRLWQRQYERFIGLGR